MSSFPAAVHHVALTVTDLAASRDWYARLFGTEPVLDEDVAPVAGHHGGYHHTIFVLAGGTIVALHVHRSMQPTNRFDAHAPGLDHLGFGCTDRAEIEQLRGRLADLGIPHQGIVDDALGHALSFRDPDGIALEFWAPRS